MFLTEKELKDLTERVRPTAQRRWLTENGYPFETGADGHPKVLKSVVESKLGVPTAKRRPQLRLKNSEAA